MSRVRPLGVVTLLLALPVTTFAQTPAAPPADPAPAPTQAVEAEAEVAAPKVELDVEALLTSPRVLPDQVGDQVWAFTPGASRRFVLLPVTLEPGDQPATLTDPGIEVRGGRFVAWHINPDERDDAQQSMDPAHQGAGGGQSMRDLLLLENNFDLGGQLPPSHQSTRGAPGVPGGAALPPDTPTYTRAITLDPDGTLRWELDRAIPGATVAEQENDYTLKLRGDRLREKEPARPQLTRDTGGGNMQQAAQQRREAEATYRAAMQEFRALVERVRSAPERFELPMPRRVYALYDVSTGLPQLSLSGPEPLPWTIGFDQLAALRALAGQGGGDRAAALASLGGLVRDTHPLSHRLVALALHRAGVIGTSQPNDPLFTVLKGIIEGPDEEARQVVLRGLVATVPPTQGSAMLLRDASKHLTPDMQIASLRGMLQGGASTPAQQRAMLDTVNHTLADESGPEPGIVLRALVEQVGPVDPSQMTLGSPLATLITGVNFESLPSDRRDEAIAYVIRDAGTQPLAAAWLNHRLLGGGDQELMRRTLELLARGTIGVGAAEPMARALTRLVFGPPAEGADARPLNLRLSARIPLGSTGHALFRGLQHGSADFRDLAWRAIANFRATPANGGGGDASAEEIIYQVLKAGLAQTPTPPHLGTFLAAHPAVPAATDGLVQIVLFSNNPAATRAAARALRGSGHEALPNSIRNLTPEQRADFATNLYVALRGAAPLAAGVFADPAAQEAAAAFGAALAEDELPDAAALGEMFGEESMLLDLAASPDPRIAAGAVGALSAMAGGDEATARELAERFAAIPDRNPQTVAQAWAPAKRDIYARRLADSAGSYRLTVRFQPLAFDQEAFGPPPPGGMPATLVPRTVTVGVVDLNVEGADAFLGNRTVTFTIPDERLALRIGSATDLANFPNPELGDLALDRLMGPIDLLPREDGSWRGEAQTPEGGVIEVLLEPVTTE